MNQRILSRRAFLRAATMTAAGAALVACVAPQAGGTDVAGGAQDVSIRFWMWNTYAPPADEVLEQGIKAWGEANGVNIEISRDSDGDIASKVMPALEAGTLPDALFAGAGDALRLGFLPYSIDTPMVHYRQDIFEAAGITVPEGQWSWEETRDLAMQAQQYTEEMGDKKVGWGFGVVKQQHDGWCDDLFRNFGADIWDEGGQNIILSEKRAAEATRALNFAKEAWDMGLFPDDAAAWDWASNNKSYQEEQSILVINSASIYTWAQANKPELAEVTGLAPKPKDVRDTTNASLRYTVVMYEESKNKETAAQLIQGLYSKEIYGPWLEKGFVTNVVHEYDTLPMWEGKRAQFNLAANIGVYSGYPAPYDNAAMAEVGGPNQPIGSMMVRVLLDNWSPEDAIAEADEFTKRVFSKYF
jgi:ABC-type glycerol-3-phosphate transport system substrate-binding protein